MVFEMAVVLLFETDDGVAGSVPYVEKSSEVLHSKASVVECPKLVTDPLRVIATVVTSDASSASTIGVGLPPEEVMPILLLGT